MAAGGDKRSFRWRWWMWLVLFAILLIPVPGRDGVWLPILFEFFEWLNNFLPENF